MSIKVARFQGEDKSTLIEKSEYGYQCLLVAIDRVINRLEAENNKKLWSIIISLESYFEVSI